MPTYLLRDIPKKLLKDFQHVCIDQEQTMKEALLELMKLAIKESLNKEE